VRAPLGDGPPGQGVSARALDGYTPDGYACDIPTVLAYIGRPTFGIGHSLGGGANARVGAAGHQMLMLKGFVEPMRADLEGGLEPVPDDGS